jgi:glyoxylase-like metal-dependent hydrolase (beta-lactamase superfamily II)
MPDQLPLDPNDRTDADGAGSTHEVTPDLAYQRLAIVNVVFAGPPGSGNGRWVLVDAGVMGSAGAIASAVNERFGQDARPAAIVLTHGHFDHVGVLQHLAERWDVPIYAHEFERPYLDGSAAYPPPDPSVGGGMMARLSGLYPRGPIDVSRWLEILPADGTVPGMPGWQWLHTPGHTVGHVSLWREQDRTLIAGDAFITTNQESAYAVATQRPEMHGPPMYFTPDWAGARASVRQLAALEPQRVVTGHGPAMQGPQTREALHVLARDFDRIAVPERGRYVDEDHRQR